MKATIITATIAVVAIIGWVYLPDAANAVLSGLTSIVPHP